MSKRVREQLGYSLLGAAMVALGVLVNVGEVDNESLRLMCSVAGIGGVALLVIYLGGLIRDRIPGRRH